MKLGMVQSVSATSLHELLEISTPSRMCHAAIVFVVAGGADRTAPLGGCGNDDTRVSPSARYLPVRRLLLECYYCFG